MPHQALCRPQQPGSACAPPSWPRSVRVRPGRSRMLRVTRRDAAKLASRSAVSDAPAASIPTRCRGLSAASDESAPWRARAHEERPHRQMRAGWPSPRLAVRRQRFACDRGASTCRTRDITFALVGAFFSRPTGAAETARASRRPGGSVAPYEICRDPALWLVVLRPPPSLQMRL